MTRSKANRLVALLLGLALLFAALPLGAGAASKIYPIEVYLKWLNLSDATAGLTNDYKNWENEEEMESLLLLSTLNSTMQMFSTAELGIALACHSYTSDRPDGTYSLVLDEDRTARITKKNNFYTILIDADDSRWEGQYNGKTGSMRFTTYTVKGGVRYAISCTDFIPTKQGLYSSHIMYLSSSMEYKKGKIESSDPPIQFTKYVSGSVLYMSVGSLGGAEDIAEFRLTKAPGKYTDIKCKDGITLQKNRKTEKMTLTDEAKNKGDLFYIFNSP